MNRFEWVGNPSKRGVRPTNVLIFHVLSYTGFMKDQTLSIRISKLERQALRRRAREEGVSQSSMVRRALLAYGITPAPYPEKTGYDVIKRLIGKLRARSKDLSTNPKHMDGFGR